MRCTNLASHVPLNPNTHKAKKAEVSKHEVCSGPEMMKYEIIDASFDAAPVC